MSPDELSPAAKRFLADHVNSVMALELLLLLRRERDSTWTAKTVTRELRCAETWAAAQLDALHAVGLTQPDAAVDGGYRFTLDEQQASVLDEIADAHRRRRSSIIRLIVSSLDSNVQSFSDAFRLRRRD